jgi:hypothetical protein
MDSPILANSRLRHSSSSSPEALKNSLRTLISLNQIRPDINVSVQISKILNQLKKKESDGQNDDSKGEEVEENNDVVVWKQDEETDSEGGGETDYLDLDDDDDDQNEQQQEINQNLFHGTGNNNNADENSPSSVPYEDAILQFLRFNFGFLNKRHLLFACCGVNPDVREVEMWLEAALDSRTTNLVQLLHQRYQTLCSQDDLRNQKRPNSTTSESKSRTSTNSSVSGVPSSLPTLISSYSVTNYSTACSQQLSCSSLFLPQNQNSFSLISIPELVEFEHADEIISSRLHLELLKRTLSPQQALRLIWRIFDEASSSSASSRVICSCIISADRILAFILSHPKLSASVVAEQAVMIISKMFHDVVPKWNFVQASPIVGSGSLVESVFKIFISFYSGGKGRRVLQILNSIVDPDAFVLGERWKKSSHPFALMSLRRFIMGSSKKEMVDQQQQQSSGGTTSKNLKAFLDLIY